MEKQHMLSSEKNSLTNKNKDSLSFKYNEIKAEDTEKSAIIETLKIANEELKRSMSSTANSNNSKDIGFKIKHEGIKELSIPKINIFSNKANSRFKFTEDIVEDKETVIVQDHISQILNKKLAKYCFYKSRSPSSSEIDQEIYIEKNRNSEWMIDIKSFLDKKYHLDG